MKVHLLRSIIFLKKIRVVACRKKGNLFFITDILSRKTMEAHLGHCITKKTTNLKFDGKK